MLKHLFFSAVFSISIGCINIWNFNKGTVSSVNVLASLLFLSLWFLYGYKMNAQKNKTFLVFNIYFWIGGIILGRIASIIRWAFFTNILIWIYRVPAYGLEALWALCPLERGWRLIGNYIILFIVPLLTSISGYLLNRHKLIGR